MDLPQKFIIDPNGDMLLILTKAKRDIADWQEEDPTPEAQSSETTQASHERPEATTEDDDILEFTQSIRAATLYESEEYHYLVSSDQLRTASDYFRNIFKHEFTESEIDEDGKRICTAEEMHPDALKIMMDVAHSNKQDILQELSLEMLVHVAIVVDYYNMHQVLAEYKDIWIERAKAHDAKPSPGTVDFLGLKGPKGLELLGYSERSVMWMFICYAFEAEIAFEQVTKGIILNLNGPCQDLGLPMPSLLIDKLEKSRIECIEKLIAQLNAVSAILKSSLTPGRIHFPCTKNFQETFRQWLSDRHLLLEQPDRLQPPFSGMSFEQVADPGDENFQPWGHIGCIEKKKEICRTIVERGATREISYNICRGTSFVNRYVNDARSSAKIGLHELRQRYG